MEKFLAELKRRQVIRVAIAYAAVAFATVSVASDFLTALRLPDWTVTFVAVATVIGFPIAVILAWVYDLTPAGVQRTPAVAPAAVAGSPGKAAGFIGMGMVIALVSVGALSRYDRIPLLEPAAAPSIAVLPFENRSTDPANAFFADGMHEEVMTQLYKLGGMTVISRTSVMQYRGTTKPVKAVAQELGVGALLEASVRREGDRVRIDARLIDSETDQPLWAESFDRELSDALIVQAEIAQEIAEALHARLSSAERQQLAEVRSRRVDPRMYELYLQGLVQAGEGNLMSGIATFKRALAIDPGYAPAHAAIARSYYFLGFFGIFTPGEVFGQLEQSARKAIELDPDLADAHATLGLHALHYRWDWKEADRRFRRALELSPNDAQVRHDYAHYLLAAGRVKDSVKESTRAAQLDPGNSMLKACAGWHEFTDRLYAPAIQQAMQALMMMPGSFWPEIILGWAYQHEGDHAKSIAALRNAVTHSGGMPFTVAALAQGLAAAGERTPAQQMLAELMNSAKERYVSAYDFAAVNAALGDTEQTFAWLQRALGERSVLLVNIGWDPRFDKVRGEARFAAVTRAMALPDRPAPKYAGAKKPAARAM